MQDNIYVSLLNNAALLVMLAVIYEVVYYLPIKNKNVQSIITGLFTALICAAVMYIPFTLQSGVVFDTRSILISATALLMGPVPTLITIIVALSMRIYSGGAGVYAGITVISTSALIGLFWRSYVYPNAKNRKIVSVYLMSLLVHMVMLLSMLLIPAPDNINVIKQIAVPVLLIYPIATVLLSSLLIHQQTLKTTQIQLKESEERFKLLFDEAPLGYQSLDSEGYIIDVNKQWCELLGYTRDEVIGKWFGSFVNPNDHKNVIDRFPIFKKQGFIHSEFKMVHKNGHPIYIAFEGRIGSDDKGNFKQTHCILQDITLRMQAENELKESERSKSVFLSNLPGMAYRCDYDRDWTMRFVSKGCLDVTGYRVEDLIDNKVISYNEVISPAYREKLWLAWESCVTKKLPFKEEYEIISKQGKQRWVLELGEAIYNQNQEVIAIEGIIVDITERKELENTLKYVSDHESITGLHNLRYLKEILSMDRIYQPNVNRALVGINLSTINLLNIRYGFVYGQKLIQRVGEELSKSTSSNCEIFHTNENRFCFYIKAYQNSEELEKFCDELVIKLDGILSSDRVNVGIGVIEIKENNLHDAEWLLKNLIFASEQSLLNVDDNFKPVFYNKELENKENREHEIEFELQRQISDENYHILHLQFQPILDLKTMKISGFEALSRLKSEQLGLVPPIEFIPIAEKTKLIIPLGLQIFQKSFEFLQELYREGYFNITLSINVSVIQLLSKNFVQELTQLILHYKVDPKNIELEITESVFTKSHSEMHKVLKELKDCGLMIAIDDFGTEYSSLSREQDYKADTLKIDKSFVRKITHLNENESITAEIISMAHKLKQAVIAEGVEEEKQLEYLRYNHCDKVQGYFISHPIDSDQALRFIKNYPTRD